MWDRQSELQWMLPAFLLPVMGLMLLGFQSGVPLEEDQANQQSASYHAELQAMNDSGISGTAIFTASEEQDTLKAEFDAEGAAEGMYTAHLSESGDTCEEEVTSALEIGSGEATGEGTINIQNQDLDHSGSLADRVAIVMSTGDSSELVACGPINPAQDG